MNDKKELANAIRILSIDAIENAGSGHPGAVMGMSDIAEVLWRKYINHNPNNPNWINRDRFVLSNGHASMLLYSILHLTGYKISINEIKNFRKFGSETPGHPEKNSWGVDVTTGPLGQGLANAVGIAIAEKSLSSYFNREGYCIIDHYTYVFFGDGCIMEGISHESCSLAGVMKLGKLIAFYDDNKISIDGEVKNWLKDDTYMRFYSYGWHVIEINGHNRNEIISAIQEAKGTSDRPSLIICKTTIAYGSPKKSGKSISHGAPLGKDEVHSVRKFLQWNYPPFIIPVRIYQSWNAKISGSEKEEKWKRKFYSYKQKYPKLARELVRRIKKTLPKKWKNEILRITKNWKSKENTISTRQSSRNTLEQLGPIVPELLGGSADLTPSNLAFWSKSISLNKNELGNYIHYGVREFGMTAIANGISLHGGFIPYSSTFLIFSEYAKNAIRMACMMKIQHIMIYTHDSIGVGEDGPTHQPIEQLSSLRMIPEISVWRPCDYVETFIAWKIAIENSCRPTVLVLSRQNLEQQNKDFKKFLSIQKGGYILKNSKKPKILILATGSEVSIGNQVYEELKKRNVSSRLISMPSVDVFEKQNKKYKNSVIPRNKKIPIIIIEAGNTNFWFKFLRYRKGKIFGINEFGKSGSEKELFKYFGIVKENILKFICTELNL
ncbi:transketolase [bacterium endosymbiont of Pedicinus badii]|uniref:transketolase n=1 Tax=bacterium endosymbiont of Pedicinus badii TaxID=1719126 RepID=UPI0009B93E49|nr:transketolase [bacterium endosymbiont of Pedicinus badii]OQM34473.1 transketolase [bacterium endosymbiont of Pedicinus badii]